MPLLLMLTPLWIFEGSSGVKTAKKALLCLLGLMLFHFKPSHAFVTQLCWVLRRQSIALLKHSPDPFLLSHKLGCRDLGLDD